MRVDLFDFDLPEDRIALRPASPRDAARLLVVRPGDERLRGPRRARPAGPAAARRRARPQRHHGHPGAPLRPARARRDGGAHRDHAAQARGRRSLARLRAAGQEARGRRPHPLRRDRESTACELGGLDAEVEEKGEGGEVALRFAFAGPVSTRRSPASASCRCRPISPASAPTDERDRADYQTLFARDEGAVAAPTAGLHFTAELFRRLDARGVARHFVTLHVGAGTFLPVKADDTAEHRMHAEWGTVSRGDRRRRSTRRGRGAAASSRSAPRRCACSRAPRGEDGTIAPFAGDTAIFITPGYRFRAVDVLMTNFHLPRSTLFMLVSAFAGLDAHAGGLCPCDRDGLSLLLLWRRLPAVP